MYKLNSKLVESIGTTYQIGEHSPNAKVTIFRKKGDGTYDMKYPFILNDALSINISRSCSMGANTATITLTNTDAFFSPDYSSYAKYEDVDIDLKPSIWRNVILPYNLVHIDIGYGEELVRVFTGYITKPQISDDKQTIQFELIDEYRRLMKPVDTLDFQRIAYENQRASFIIDDLLKKAGVSKFVIDTHSIEDKDFTINNFYVDLGTTYESALKELLKSMNHVIKVDREGVLKANPSVIPSEEAHIVDNLKDVLNITEGTLFIDDSLIRNKIIVMGDENKWQAFIDEELLKYLNNEVIVMGVDVPWVKEDKEFKNVADFYFFQMRRKLKNITVTIIGNPSIDLSDIVYLETFISSQQGKYMVSSIETSISDSGYFDRIQLEPVITSCEIAKKTDDKYEPYQADISEDGETSSPIENQNLTLEKKLILTAKRYLGTFYQHGGNKYIRKEDYGFDSSNFIFAVLNANNALNFYSTLPELKEQCESVEIENISMADLVFFLNDNNIPVKCGFYLEDNKVIGMKNGSPDITTEGVARLRDAKCDLLKTEGNICIGRLKTNNSDNQESDTNGNQNEENNNQTGD